MKIYSIKTMGVLSSVLLFSFWFSYSFAQDIQNSQETDVEIQQDNSNNNSDIQNNDAGVQNDKIKINKNKKVGQINSTYHTIKTGDTLSEIAKRYKVPLVEILVSNKIGLEARLNSGDKIIIPKLKQIRHYLVVSGDSWLEISKKTGVDVDELQRANKNVTVLKQGDIITLPASAQQDEKNQKSKSDERLYHIIKQGDSFYSIAHKYGVKVNSLLRFNNLTQDSKLVSGMKIRIPPGEDATYRTDWQMTKSGKLINGGVSHIVQLGQSLKAISKAYNVSLEKIKNANPQIKSMIPRVGTVVFIPGAQSVVSVSTPVCPPPIKVRRVGTTKVVKVRLVNCNGKINKNGREIISKLSGPRRSKSYKLLNPRLLILIQKIAEHWPGKLIEIVSGYRLYVRGRQSKHFSGCALDFRVAGVSRENLRDYVKNFKNVGVGYYPNSTFVHLDVRNESAYWIDISRPGQKAQYIKQGETTDEAAVDREIVPEE